MATLSDITDEIVGITDRGEDPAAIYRAIVRATLKAHLADFWLRDMVEVKIIPEVTGLRLDVFLSTSLPGYRKISYINGYDDDTDPENPTVMQEFRENGPWQTRDVYGVKKSNIYYVAGDVLVLWANGVPPKLLIGYWKLPEVGPGTYKSWIAEMFHPIIVDEACGEIFGAVGDDDEAKRRRDMFVPNLQIVRINDIEATGR